MTSLQGKSLGEIGELRLLEEVVLPMAADAERQLSICGCWQ